MTRRLGLGTAGLIMAVALVGCGDQNSFNAELTAIHMVGPNCTQSACHAGFTIGGTVYDGLAGSARVPGATLWVTPPSGPEVGIVADEQANFWSMGTYSGDYLFRVGSGPSSGPHPMPDRAPCNTCHVPIDVTDPDTTGRIF
ncbi:MAG: hypothetical protein ACOYXR_04470 [Nitrospirota bacterium]